MNFNFPIFYYTKRVIQKHLKSSIIYIICLSLFIFCFCSFAVLIISLMNSNNLYRFQLYGTEDVVLKNVTHVTVQKLQSSSDISDIGFAQTFGIAPIENIPYTDYAVFGTVDESVINQGNLQLIKGEWPSTVDEIVLEESLCSKLRLPKEPGESITLPFRGFDGSFKTETYRITGICKNFSDLQGGTDNTTETEYRLPNAILSNQYSYHEPIIHTYITFVPNVNVSSFLETYQLNPQSIHMNDNKLDSDSSIDALLMILFAAFIVTAVFSIYANISITKNRKIQRIYNLKIIGLSNWQITKHLLLELSIYYAISLFFGLSTGILIPFFIIQNLIVNYIPYFQITVSWCLILFIIFASYFIIIISHLNFISKYLKMKPNQVFRKKESKLHGAKTYHIKSPLFNWGIRSFRGNSDIYAKLMISFTLLVTVVISGSFISKIAVFTLEDKIQADYIVHEYNGGNISLLDIPVQMGYGISSIDKDRASDCSEIDSCFGIKRIPFKILDNNNKIHGGADRLSDRYQSGELAEDYKKDLVRYGYKENDNLYSFSLTGIDDELFEWMKPYVIDGATNIKDIKNKNSVIVVINQDNSPYNIGDELLLTQSFQAEGSAEPKRFDYHCVISSIVRIPDNATQLKQLVSQNPVNFVVLSDFLDLLPAKIHYNSLYINLRQPNEYAETENILYSIREIYPDSQIVSLRQQTQDQYMAILSTKVILAILIMILLLFSVTMFTTVVYHLINDRYRLWGTLRTFGTNLSDVMKYQMAEVGVLCLISWIAGLCFALMIIYFIKINIVEISWLQSFPFLMTFISFVIIFLFSFVICLILFKQIFRKSIVQLLSSLTASNSFSV
jgi:ABC-type antimicrobial peptide transport system permease subunit